MGTGAYTFSNFKPDEGITANRNDSYWGAKPPIKTIDFKFISEDSTRLLALRSGQIDGTFIVPLAQSKSWETAGERQRAIRARHEPGSVRLQLRSQAVRRRARSACVRVRPRSRRVW